MDINKEEVFDLLQSFEEKHGENDKIPQALENYLKFVAKTGDILYPWTNIKPLIRKKVELVLDEFHEQHPMPAAVPAFNFEELKKEIIDTLDSFSGAPFTIQRICELVTLPTKHYKRTDKFMRGLEKNVLVVSHVDPKNAAAAERPASPPKSIFAPEPSYHLFERSLNATSLNSHSLQPSTSSQNDPEAGPSSLDSTRSLSDSEAGTSSLSSSVSSKIILPSMSMSSSTEPAPLQQLDSFTTVFSSPPSTPLAVVSNMGPFESASSSSSSSSSGSSAESSPQPPGDPCSPDDLENGENEENGHELESQTSSLDSSSSETSGGDMSSQEQVNQQGDLLVDNASNVQSSNEEHESGMSADEVSEEKIESISPPQSEAMEVTAAEATESQPTATEVQSQEEVNFGTASIEQKEEMQTEEETESRQEEQSGQPLEELQGTLV